MNKDRPPFRYLVVQLVVVSLLVHCLCVLLLVDNPKLYRERALYMHLKINGNTKKSVESGMGQFEPFKSSFLNDNHPFLNAVISNQNSIPSDQIKGDSSTENENEKDYQIVFKTIEQKDEIKYSIVLPTHERFYCFQAVFEKLLVFRPNNTEIVVVDDHSTSKIKLDYYNEIRSGKKQIENIQILYHRKSYGAFHSKLDGFRASRGQYIMSIDDDDSFENKYFFEIVKSIEDDNENKYDFYVTKRSFVEGHFSMYRLKKLDNIIELFHNHVCFAFRKSLLNGIKYPEKTTYIVRDDAALVIPLYLNSDFSRFLFFLNRHLYRVSRYCVGSGRESERYFTDDSLVKNGFDFLIQYAVDEGKEQYINSIRKAYSGFSFAK